MKGTLLFLTLAFGLLSGIPVWATSATSAQCHTQLISLFKTQYRDQYIYKSKDCDSNCGRFLNFVELHNLNIDQTNVLIISKLPRRSSLMTKRNPENWLSPHNTRSMNTQWSFHSVIESQGHIIDFDYSSKPTVDPINQYFPHMFLPYWKFFLNMSDKTLSHIYVREIPGVVFRQRFQEQAIEGFRNWEELDKYPFVTVEDYLKSKNKF
ncbi:MAG: hypothetical protein SGI74_14585 [Oligoflexia bacterium]|nr:hypothetical protein [Oligoflexia bacterium]